jgi:molybdopterin converting factor small subunit
MKVTVHFMAQLRTAAGAPSVQLELADGATLKDAANKAAERLGQPLREILLDEQGQPRSGVLAFAGDQQVAWNTLVSSGSSEITLLSGMAGG